LVLESEVLSSWGCAHCCVQTISMSTASLSVAGNGNQLAARTAG
jgi:hypothetical protein